MSETVPFLDVGAACEELHDEITQSIMRVVDSGWYILGDELAAFEAEFAGYVGAGHCAGTGSGLDALTLALRAHGISDGDEVIVPCNTFIATWLSVSQVGATPVPVDPDPDTFNIDPERAAEAITDRTRAIIPVHLYGRPADMDSINDIAGANGLVVIEDAAQAHGAEYKGQRIGAGSNTVAWSFYPGKNLGALGDGGAVTSNDREVIDNVKMLRNYGSTKKYVHEAQGINSRLDEIQAAVLRQKLSKLEAWNSARKAIANNYIKSISCSAVQLPRIDDDYASVWHLFVIKTESRRRLIEHLGSHGIATAIHYPISVHRQKAYESMDFSGYQCQVGEQLQSQVLSLPIGPHLSSEHVQRVIEAVNRFS